MQLWNLLQMSSSSFTCLDLKEVAREASMKVYLTRVLVGFLLIKRKETVMSKLWSKGGLKWHQGGFMVTPLQVTVCVCVFARCHWLGDCLFVIVRVVFLFCFLRVKCKELDFQQQHLLFWDRHIFFIEKNTHVSGWNQCWGTKPEHKKGFLHNRRHQFDLMWIFSLFIVCYITATRVWQKIPCELFCFFVKWVGKGSWFFPFSSRPTFSLLFCVNSSIGWVFLYVQL